MDKTPSSPGLKEKKGEHPFGDTGQMVCFAVFIVLWVADSFLAHKTTSLARYLPLVLRLAFLGLTLAAGLSLMGSAHSVVGGKKRSDHVIESGAFRLVRHPLYLGSILIYLGLSVATFSLVSLAAFLGIFVFYNFIAAYEERLLEVRYGQTYIRYRQKTGRWLPRLGGA